MTSNNQSILLLEQFMPYRLNRISELVSQGFAAVYREKFGLTRPEWRTLATIGQFRDITAKEVGIHSSMHKTKVSRAVVALEKRNWVVRATDTQDRRVEHLSLTPSGVKAYMQLAEAGRAYEAELMGQLTGGEQESLVDAVSALERSLDGRVVLDLVVD